jgi:hypothetical protein
VRVCPTGAIHDILPLAKLRAGTMDQPATKVRSVCPYCAVGCQLDLEVRDGQVARVTSPWIEEPTPNTGSTCVKGRFGTDFILHRDRLTKPLIRRGWSRDAAGTWSFDPSEPTAARFPRRSGPWVSVETEGRAGKNRRPRTNPFRRTDSGADDALGDPRDRLATPADWFSPFREATWEEAMDLTAQQLKRLRDTHGPDSLATFASAKCANEENYVLQKVFRAGIGTNNIDHCTRLCHSSSVSAMQRSIATSAASGSMREVEHESDVIFLLGANTTESHPVFGAALKRALKRGAKLIRSGSTGMMPGPAFKKGVPAITDFSRVQSAFFNVKHKGNIFEQEALWADENLFTVFSFPLLHGDAKTALKDMHSVVLSEELAKKYFGKTDVVGQVLQIKADKSFEPFVVTAVAKNSPQNSSIRLKMILPLALRQSVENDNNWINFYLNTFVVLKP